jgi:ATP-dependent DNA helicase RecG
MSGSTFVRQYARRIVVESSGGFPVGITTENVLDRQAPRNRRLAEVFAKCGLVERSGQGMNLMFEQSIRQGKLVPDFRGTYAHHVVVTLHGTVQDPRFPQFLETIGRETLATFDTHDYLVLDLIDRDESVSAALLPRLRRLVELGVVERIGRGKGTRYLLSRRFYVMSGRKGAYTRRRALDDEAQKELLLRHLRDNPSGSALSELRQVLPQVGERKVQFLLQELRAEGRAELKGARRWARWFTAKSMTPGSGV